MRLILDNQSFEATESNATELLSSFFRECSEKDRVLYSCILDEDVIEDFANLNQLIEKSLAELRVINIVTIPRAQLVCETIDSITGYISSLQRFTEDTLAQLQSGTQFRDIQWDLFLSGLEWLISALGAILQQDLILSVGSKLHEQVTGFNAIIQELGDAFENKDLVSLCDVLEYEFTPKLTDLEETLKEIGDLIGAKQYE